uniref:20 kDa chaperonin, chloroplastic n=1 Tax=Oryza rufipogon TaxID=4529 RepID=A0A0E0PUN8_ORYRU
MSSVQLSGAGVAAVAFTKNGASSFDGLRLAPPSVRVCSSRRPSRSLVVKAATVVTPKIGAEVVYSKYAGTEVQFNDTKHLILKEDDIIGVLETDDVKDMKPLNDRVLIKVAEAEDKTAGGLILTETTKEKPSIGTVVAVGPGPLDDEGKRQPLSVSAGSTVMYSKYAGSEFKGADGTNYIVLRVSDVMAVLS